MACLCPSRSSSAQTRTARGPGQRATAHAQGRATGHLGGVSLLQVMPRPPGRYQAGRALLRRTTGAAGHALASAVPWACLGAERPWPGAAGEDLEGYAGAGLYDSITMDATELRKVDYAADRRDPRRCARARCRCARARCACHGAADTARWPACRPKSVHLVRSHWQLNKCGTPQGTQSAAAICSLRRGLACSHARERAPAGLGLRALRPSSPAAPAHPLSRQSRR
jgi:hypothetical protein